MRQPRRTIVRAVCIASALSIVVLSLVPLQEPPIGDFALADKIGHASAYFVLAFLVFASLLPGPRLRLALLAACGCLLLGGAIELVQPLVERNREVGDLAANAIGSAGGAGLAAAVERLLRRVLLGSADRH